MKMKQTILTLLFTLLTVNLWAEDAKIIVWLNDGNKTEILFNQMPEFLYADGHVSAHRECGQQMEVIFVHNRSI